MKSFTCTNINKTTKNEIVSYELQDSTGKILRVSYNKLKLMLENNKIEVVNLTVENNEIVEDQDYQLKNMRAKFKMFGTTYKSDCGHEYYVIENPDTTIVYIPDDTEYLIKSNNEYGKPDFCNIDCSILKVIGGSGLTSAYNMFYRCKAQSLDLSLLDTSSVTYMYGMFYCCKAHSIDISSFDTSSVTDMGYMFGGCKVQSLDLSSFDTSKVTNMEGMFWDCDTQSLDLSSFDTSKVEDMEAMFGSCKAKSIDLRSFDTSKVTSMQGMFDNCEAKSIDLSSFDTSSVTAMWYMFQDCEAQVKATDRNILAELHDR